MLLASTGFKTATNAGTAWADMFRQGAIMIYGSARPATPDAAPGASPIAMITNYGLPWTPSSLGYGLFFRMRDQFVIGEPSQTWILAPNGFALGESASWWRLVAPFDDGLPSITQFRLDGDIGTKGIDTGKELLLDTTSLVPGAGIPVNGFFYAIPPIT